MTARTSKAPVSIRDRIVALRRVKASSLIAHPNNWRTHPATQRAALRGVLTEIGYADALLVRETPDGLMLIDGHLRAETTPDQDVPVLVLDLDEAEADKLLLTLDPLAGMATADTERLADLLASVQTGDAAVRKLLDGLRAPAPPAIESIPSIYQLVVECTGERMQQELFERMTGEGYPCRLLTL